VPVEVRQPDPGALESLQTLISPLLHPLATTGIIIIFVIFILLQREDLRNRLIRLAGSHDLQRTTAALDDAARRLSRLYLIQLMLNGPFGLVIGTGVWLIGVPSAILWGILAAVLRFVPYIGAAGSALYRPWASGARRGARGADDLEYLSAPDRRLFDSLPGLYGWDRPRSYALFRSTAASKTTESYHHFVLLAEGG